MSRNARIARAALGVLALLALWWLSHRAAGAVPRFAAWTAGLGLWGPLVFVLGYAAAVVAFVPASLLTLAAGALFGVTAGTAYAFAAAVLGSSGAFLVSRHLARARFEQRFAASPRFRAIDGAIAAQGRRIVFLLRLSPAFPFNLLNYALGLTRVSLADYLVASLGMLPGTLLYTYSGRIVGDVALLASGAGRPGGALRWALVGVGLAATAAATWLLSQAARRALDAATAQARA